MAAQEGKPRFCGTRPVGQALAVRVPDGMPVDYVEKVARVLLDTQPRGRFPGYQEFGQTDDRQLVIRGLGHDPAEIERFSGRLHRKFEQAMAWQRVARRAEEKQVAYQRVLRRLIRRLERSRPSPEETRRDKRITLVILAFLALLTAINVWADRRRERWECWELTPVKQQVRQADMVLAWYEYYPGYCTNVVELRRNAPDNS
ncbi:MAG: hypothetical protein OXH37_05735, partial [Gammaproteobacteria bacterium]|nr:hypothetical protein [Gammaproteobacteria bacterium]